MDPHKPQSPLEQRDTHREKETITPALLRWTTLSLFTEHNQSEQKSCYFAFHDLLSFLVRRMHRSGLLLLSLCAGSLVTHSGAFGSRRLCGIQLVEALLLVCGDKGLLYQPARRVREHAFRIMMRNSVPFLRQTGAAAQSGERGTVAKRGIVEQCCHFYCDYYDLENYCNT
ncbi:insulin-like [Cyprinus carpio]|uniref:Insulin-like n=1 Tax=Cyprinus carpio TaxID=7962 RepID=A0A9Q9W3J3_CYPCA|nr:insulin-like [Cyprinus carpio]